MEAEADGLGVELTTRQSSRQRKGGMIPQPLNLEVFLEGQKFR